MTSIADGAVKIQTTSESRFLVWRNRLDQQVSSLHGVLRKINEQIRFARKRFGRYEVIDFLAVLFGYAISGERTQEACWIEQEPPGWCSTSMGRARPPANALYPRPMNFPHPFVGWMTSAPLATEVANAERLFGHAQRLLRPIAESRLGSFGNRGNGRYREELRQGLAAIGRYRDARLNSKLHAHCCGSMGNMAREPCSPMQLGSRL
jgi:hypothetical protein